VWRAADRAPARLAFLVGLLGLAVMLAAIPCTFRALTGVVCPFCGMTRATLALAHGHVGESLAAHPLASVVLLAAAWGMWLLARGRPVRVPAWVLLAGVGVVWAVNLVVN
jgi:hypothetical protein